MRDALGRPAALLLAALLLACGPGPKTGPGELKWDREVCEHCQMVISERRHAAQVRIPGEARVHAFDDLGCALLWLDAQGLAGSEPREEVWVRDPEGAHWVDAYGAVFVDGLPTPMQYGFGTAAEGIPLDDVHHRVRDEERARKSKSRHRHDGSDTREGTDG